MKVSCPNCNKVFNAPSEWAGRKVKCPGCKGPVSLPTMEDAGAKDLGFDLGSLASMETGGEAILRDKKVKPLSLKEAQAAATAAKEESRTEPDAPVDPTVRICPGCGERVRSEELYSDLICRLCGAAIPGLELKTQQIKYTTDTGRIAVGLKFYSGFGNAALYPVPALGSISIGMVIALAAIAVPLFPILAFVGASTSNEVSREKSDFGWVNMFIMAMFSVEALYFGAVSYYVMIDTIRTTTSGAEQAPPLTWSPTKLGGALGGYAALIGFYALIVLLLFMFQKGSMPTSMKDLTLLSDPVSLVVLTLLTFAVPMNLIGLASTQAVDGLNPVKFVPSIGKTLGHYIFLFLIVALYMGFYTGVMIAVMSWAGPMLTKATSGGATAGLAKIMINALMGLAAWSVLIGLALYFGYAMGRVLGLFSRTYRGRMSFEL